MSTDTNGQRSANPLRRPTKLGVKTVAWSLATATFFGTSMHIGRLDPSTTYIRLGNSLNTLTLMGGLLLLALVAFCFALTRLVQWLSSKTKTRGIVYAYRAAGWFVGVCVTIILSFQILISFVFGSSANYVFKAPKDERSILVVDRSVLLIGSLAVYEPQTWSTYKEVARLSTNNGYDPFKGGAFRITWTDKGALLEYVDDYSHPDQYREKFIPLR